MPIMLRRALVAALLALTPLALTGTASAADYGYVSGDPYPGRVVRAAARSAKCEGNGPRLVLRNGAGEPDAKRRSGPPGTFGVCVTREAFNTHGVGSWFNNRAGTFGQVG